MEPPSGMKAADIVLSEPIEASSEAFSRQFLFIALVF